MAQKKNPLKNAKVVIRQSPATLKIVLIVLILFSIATLAALRWVHTGILEETENMRKEASALEHANSELVEKTGELGSVKSLEDIAREELGLVDPDTVMIDPQS